jgi:hypothetical protein
MRKRERERERERERKVEGTLIDYRLGPRAPRQLPPVRPQALHVARKPLPMDLLLECEFLRYLPARDPCRPAIFRVACMPAVELSPHIREAS